MFGMVNTIPALGAKRSLICFVRVRSKWSRIIRTANLTEFAPRSEVDMRVTSENNELDSNVFMKLIREELMLVSSATDIAEVRPLFGVQRIIIFNSSSTREHK